MTLEAYVFLRTSSSTLCSKNEFIYFILSFQLGLERRFQDKENRKQLDIDRFHQHHSIQMVRLQEYEGHPIKNETFFIV